MPRVRAAARLTTALFGLLAAGGCGATQATEALADFVVAVGSERFVLRVTDPETIRLARERVAGSGIGFPAGPVRRGDGGFNPPWSWHLDPAETRIVEVAVEVCDATPSYLEAHLDEFPRYCPWGAVIVSEMHGSFASPRDPASERSGAAASRPIIDGSGIEPVGDQGVASTRGRGCRRTGFGPFPRTAGLPQEWSGQGSGVKGPTVFRKSSSERPATT